MAQHVKVVQSRQSADEVFARYGYHQPAATVPRSAAEGVFIASFFDHRHTERDEILEAGH